MKTVRFAFIIFLFYTFHAHAQNTNSGFAVVELFTSEGCSSCPPAEKVMSKLIDDAKKNHKNIYCLEYHVDYWNRGGWKDPFSKNQFTMRQNNYSSALQQRELYTPQMIVNGEAEFVGSNAEKADAAISKALMTGSKMDLKVMPDSAAADTLYLHYSANQPDKNFSLHFAIVENHLVSKVGKGENSGRTLTHDGVVRILYSIPFDKLSGNAKVPVKGITLNENCELISFVQNKQTMKILGAAKNTFSEIRKPVKY